MTIEPAKIVLVVDDEPMLRLIAGDALTDAGFEVVVAEGADHALQLLLQRDDVGVLFTDVNMPGKLDGMDLARLVHLAWPDIKIVVTSGRDLGAPVPDPGCFLRKPYAVDELAEVLAAPSPKAS